MAFEIPKINMFQQPIQQIDAVGARGSEKIGGLQKTGGQMFGGLQGGTAVDNELADMRRFIGPYNGTGQIRPQKAEANLFYLA